MLSATINEGPEGICIVEIRVLNVFEAISTAELYPTLVQFGDISAMNLSKIDKRWTWGIANLLQWLQIYVLQVMT